MYLSSNQWPSAAGMCCQCSAAQMLKQLEEKEKEQVKNRWKKDEKQQQTHSHKNTHTHRHTCTHTHTHTHAHTHTHTHTHDTPTKTFQMAKGHQLIKQFLKAVHLKNHIPNRQWDMYMSMQPFPPTPISTPPSPSQILTHNLLISLIISLTSHF